MKCNETNGKKLLISSMDTKHFLLIIFLFSTTILPVYSHANNSCSLEMFGNDTSAYWACATQFALQSNWFPSPIAGLFSYLIWNGFDGFWQNGAVLEPMTNFMAYTNSTRYISVIRSSYRQLYSLLEAYGPYPSFDDMGWYGLSYARIYEVLGDQEFLQSSLDIFNWCWQTGWDTTGSCYGGFWFDNNVNAKQTITNVEMFQLGARLLRHTKDKTILKKLNQIYEFIIKTNIVNETTYLLSDGIFLENCTTTYNYGPTYNNGVFIGGLVEVYKITNNKTYLDLAQKIARATIAYSTNKTTGIFTEYCDPNCDDDGIMFKGIFVRNLRYLMDALSDDQTTRNEFQTFLDFNVKAITEVNMCEKIPICKCNITFKDGPPYYNVSGPVFSPDWNGPFTYGAPMQQTSALDLFVSSIKPDTKCNGKMCSYDPYYPPPQPLTCGSKPCPAPEVCCEYSPYTSYTCCTTGQKCIKGVCT